MELTNISLQKNSLFLLASLSIRCKKGEITGVIGPNGAGKTTLLKVLSGIEKPSQGEIFWEGNPFSLADRRTWSQTIAFVPQNGTPAFAFPVEEMVAMGMFARRGSFDRQEEVEKALSAVQALHLRRRSITSLSAGERQRIYIARAIAAHTPIIVLDEPSSHLDLGQKQRIWELLSLLKGEKKIVIVSSHDHEMVERYCEEVVLLDGGRLVAQGRYEEVMTPQSLAQRFHAYEV